ncbi:hypothetical protein ACIA49_33445 [Kribbella sp. NPDC051587]|uniref:hypothetical protein n=1 Tax=Kribbella sp. NPDC051587 TaxID=3364119 RepID=UPI00379DBFF5
MTLLATLRGFGGMVAVAASLLAVGVSPAVAGYNGQHVRVCGGHEAGNATVWGTDQNGNFAQTPLRLVRGGCAEFGDYWFKGNVTALVGDVVVGHVHHKEVHATVPVSQADDWFRINF